MYYMCKLYVHITGTCILSYTAACVGTVIKPTRKKTGFSLFMSGEYMYLQHTFTFLSFSQYHLWNEGLNNDSHHDIIDIKRPWSIAVLRSFRFRVWWWPERIKKMFWKKYMQLWIENYKLHHTLTELTCKGLFRYRADDISKVSTNNWLIKILFNCSSKYTYQ